MWLCLRLNAGRSLLRLLLIIEWLRMVRRVDLRVVVGGAWLLPIAIFLVALTTCGWLGLLWCRNSNYLAIVDVVVAVVIIVISIVVGLR